MESWYRNDDGAMICASCRADALYEDSATKFTSAYYSGTIRRCHCCGGESVYDGECDGADDYDDD